LKAKEGQACWHGLPSQHWWKQHEKTTSQQVHKKMTKGYLIGFVKVKNSESFTPYKQAAWQSVESLWSRLLPAQMRENANGIAEDSAMVVVEFEKAKAFYDSDGYQAAIKLRKYYSESTFVLDSGEEKDTLASKIPLAR
jgi:uncharacterized protein (DUF1330 family)